MVLRCHSELWADIDGYEGLYQVSTFGNVKSLRTNKVLKPHEDKGGYLTACLYWKCKYKCCKVHRLVASAFLTNPENKRTVNHIDGNKKNNRLENLEWASHSENITHAISTGLRIVTEAQRLAARQTGKRTCEQNRPRKAVICINGGDTHEFESAHAAARYVNGNASAIVRCCKGKKKTYKGCGWRYAECR